MQTLSDEELMKQYAAGKLAAFTILYNRHRGPLFRYLLRHIGQQNAIVEELYQETWASIINSRDSYVASAKFTTYLYRVAHNKMLDYFRLSAVRHELQSERMDDELNTVEYESEEKVEPQQQTHWKSCIEQLLALVNQLPNEQREAFVLRHEGDHNVSAIAEITGVNLQTAKSRLRYAMRKLRDKLSDDCL